MTVAELMLVAAVRDIAGVDETRIGEFSGHELLQAGDRVTFAADEGSDYVPAVLLSVNHRQRRAVAVYRECNQVHVCTLGVDAFEFRFYCAAIDQDYQKLSVK